MHRLSLPILCASLLLMLGAGCGIYSFTGGSLKPGLQTVSVELFENNASIIVPTLAQDLTESVEDRIVGQSNLRLVNYGGDLQFSGTIKQYDVKPVAIQGNETAAQNRLTVGVQIKYECEKYPEDSWDKSFTQFSDFSSTVNLSDVETGLVEDIIDRLSQDIFNKALSNW